MLSFSQRVVKLVLSIPPGRVTTYGRIARAAGGGSMTAQSITKILWKAEQGGVKHIPWHRIVYADGHIWIDQKHRQERLRLYQQEGIQLDEKDRIVHFDDILIEFK